MAQNASGKSHRKGVVPPMVPGTFTDGYQAQAWPERLRWRDGKGVVVGTTQASVKAVKSMDAATGARFVESLARDGATVYAKDQIGQLLFRMEHNRLCCWEFVAGNRRGSGTQA